MTDGSTERCVGAGPDVSVEAQGPSSSHRYRIFELSIDSDIVLPGWLMSRSTNAGRESVDLRVRIADPESKNLVGFLRRYDWRDAKGTVICSVFARGDEYLLHYPETVSFHFGNQGRIDCVIGPEGNLAILRHTLVQQAIPRWLAHHGKLIVHASAVIMPNGGAVAFVGDSGFGKSTLARHGVAEGARLLADDSLLLEVNNGDAVVSGPGGPGGDARVQPERLVAIFLLNDPGHPVPDVSLRPVRGQRALVSLMGALFSLDVRRKETTIQGFHRLGEALRAGVVVYALNYPRKRSLLDAVWGTVRSVTDVTDRAVKPSRDAENALD